MLIADVNFVSLFTVFFIPAIFPTVSQPFLENLPLSSFELNNATSSQAPPLMSYIPYTFPVVLAFTPFTVLYAFVVPEAELALVLPPPFPVIKLLLLFISISFPFLPYLLCVKYATAPHSLFFIICEYIKLLIPSVFAFDTVYPYVA